MEVVVVMLLVVIAIELALILIRLTEEKKEEVETKEHKTRRDTEGVFANPLGDSYRRHKGLYVPIQPNSKMLDGDEDDEV